MPCLPPAPDVTQVTTPGRRLAAEHARHLGRTPCTPCRPGTSTGSSSKHLAIVSVAVSQKRTKPSLWPAISVEPSSERRTPYASAFSPSNVMVRRIIPDGASMTTSPAESLTAARVLPSRENDKDRKRPGCSSERRGSWRAWPAASSKLRRRVGRRLRRPNARCRRPGRDCSGEACRSRFPTAARRWGRNYVRRVRSPAFGRPATRRGEGHCSHGRETRVSWAALKIPRT